MCGIFFYKGNKVLDKKDILESYFRKIQHRGPDDSSIVYINDVMIGFHHLIINGYGKQPFVRKPFMAVCNGEIFNFQTLAKTFQIELETGSDCEILLPLFEKVGIESLYGLLEGEYAFVIYNTETGETYAGRDHLGIRSLYYGISENKEEMIWTSEMKAIPLHWFNTVRQFPPASIYNVSSIQSMKREWIIDYTYSKEDWIQQIRSSLIQACQVRLLSDRNIGCILSGGLDSSIISAIVCQLLRQRDPTILIRTYSIGMKDATDLVYAKCMAEFLKTEHYEFMVTKEELLNHIEKTIYQIESYDVTTVRASVGNYLLCQKIKDLHKDTVIFCGDVSDELFGSYKGFQLAKDDDSFFKENYKMIRHIHFFDVLRSDKCISGAGLEARVPFSDEHFVNIVMSIPSHFKRFYPTRIEKELLREAFKDFLPTEIYLRRKEAFSDGISSEQNSWFQLIQNYIDQKIPIVDETQDSLQREMAFYKHIFDRYYPDRQSTIPYYWKQPFTHESDPSARKLSLETLALNIS